MKKGTFEDLLPQETVERMLLSNVSVGEVFRMHLGKEENIKGKNYQLFAKKYAFLKEKDRFVDCSDLKTITGKRFKELFGNDKAKGIIMQDDLELIKGAVISYEDASPKMLRRFGLLL